MAVSPYTIDVDPCQADGTRTIYLQHYQQPCFSTTHRDVSRVCLAKWPVKRSVEETGNAADLDECEAIRARRTDEVYQTLLEFGNPRGPALSTGLLASTDASLPASSASHARRGDPQDASPEMEDYLCVFHREELADQFGRFTLVQPHTICSAYRVKDTTAVELVLHNIAPRDISTAGDSRGSGGVFILGHRQTTKGGYTSSAPLEHHGVLYRPAADLWWMGSPLSVKPVYVAVTQAEALLGANNEPSKEVVSRVEATSSVAGPRTLSPPRQDSPTNTSSGSRSGGVVGAHGEVDGRTAQGQFDFQRTRSASPLPCSLAEGHLSASRADANIASSTVAPPLVPFPCSPSPAGINSPRSKFVSVAATVLTQIQLYDPETKEPLLESVAVVRTAPDELGLALTTPQYTLDCMLWQWWPQRLRLSRLTSRTAALSVVVSPHATLARQVLFLYDAHHSRLRVLRTPDLHSGAGDFELLFSFECGDLPFVLPCLHISHPAPIAVCNYPRPNWVAVYDVQALLETPSADTVAMQLNLEAHQARHPHQFGAVKRTPDTDAAFEATDVNGRGSGKPSGAEADPQTADTLAEKRVRQAENAKAWVRGASQAVAHPIRSLLYHCYARLVLQYDWPSGAAQPAGPNGSDGNISFPFGGGREDRRSRRRCEGTVSYTVHYPCLSEPEQPLLVRLLEALCAAIGPRAVADVEYQLFMEAWRASCAGAVGTSRHPLEVCMRLLRWNVRTALSGEKGGAVEEPQSAEPDEAARSATEDDASDDAAAESCTFMDPSMLTLQRVRQALRSGHPSPSKKTRETMTRKESTGTAAFATWTKEQAGLALVALHLLFESCRLQETLWTLLPSLAELNREWSALLHWTSYVEFYDAMMSKGVSADPAATVKEEDGAAAWVPGFAACLSSSRLADCFESVFLAPAIAQDAAASALSAAQRSANGHAVCPSVEFAHGDAPDLFHTLTTFAMGENGSRAVGSGTTPVHAAVFGSWPLLRNVPPDHPITVANRIVLLYRDVFSHFSSSAATATADVLTGTTALGRQLDRTRACEANIEVCDAAKPNCGVDLRWWERLCAKLVQQHLSARLVCQTLNTGVVYPLLEAITKGREQADATWPAVLLDLVGRRDRCPPSSLTSQLITAGRHVVETAAENAVVRQYRVALAEDDGVSVRPDFRSTWQDSRLDMAQNLFNTVTPISLSGFEDRSEELTGALELLSCRARAMPLGRGMLTMCTQSFKVQDSIPIPPLNLDGRTNDGIRIVNKSTEELMWPLFHNGCAAGLRFLPLPPSFEAAAGGVSDNTRSFVVPGLAVGGGAGSAPDGQAGFSTDTTLKTANAPSITKQWVMYQTKNIGNAASRAGLLLATGILGHLTVLQRTDIFYLLISRQEQYVWREATTIAVMLGLSCSFCSTSNEAVFRCLSVHVQSLNPSAEDIEVSLDVQTAALVSLGLLCQQAPSNTFLVEVFLVEISRLPTDEHCSKREGYVLGAGFGLGQLLLGVGQTHGIPYVEDRLLAFMTGAPRSSAVATREGVEYLEETLGRGEAGHFLARALLSQEQREYIFNSCASVYEGCCYNVFVSGPAAAVALGLMYLQTDSVFMATKVCPPNRRTALQKLSPLMCHLRSVMASLICWSSIEPSRDWLYRQVPSSLLDLATTSTAGDPSSRGALRLATQQRNYLLMNLAHCIAGHVMALGLRYAGTMDSEVRDVIFAELRGFLAGQIGSTKTAIPAVQRVTGAYEICILTCASAVSLVMAGTGDLKVFAVLQHLHRRTHALYGSHMAVSMSLGLLFLGSGRLTVANHKAAVAALLMAFYPAWPSEPEDNTYHLQALRHLYGLAVVPRVMDAVDAMSHQPVSVPIRIVQRRRGNATVDNAVSTEGGADVTQPQLGEQPTVLEQRSGEEASRVICTRTPCLYPPVDMIERVEVRGAQYYPLVFYPSSKELNQSPSMVFRVMAKDGTSITTADDHGSHRAAHTHFEARLMDWLHRVFHHRTTTTTEALTVIDSVKLMLYVQRRLVSTAMAGEALLSCDFTAAVKDALEKRYSYIFLHRTSESTPSVYSARRGPPYHPMYRLFVANEPYAKVLESVAAHPHGTEAFPCDFASLMLPSPPRYNASAAAAVMHKTNGADAALEVADIRRWFTESLHYYGLKQRAQKHVREAFRALGLSAYVADAGGAEMADHVKKMSTVSPVERLATFLRLQADAQLPLATLEKVWACCVA